MIYLDVSRRTSLERGLERGLARGGEAMRPVCLARYLPAEDIYLSEVDP